MLVFTKDDKQNLPMDLTWCKAPNHKWVSRVTCHPYAKIVKNYDHFKTMKSHQCDTVWILPWKNLLNELYCSDTPNIYIYVYAKTTESIFAHIICSFGILERLQCIVGVFRNENQKTVLSFKLQKFCLLFNFITK